MTPDEKQKQEIALPIALRFTLTFAVAIAIGWFALFALLRSRW